MRRLPIGLRTAAVLLAGLFSSAGDLPPRIIVAYHDSWNEIPAADALSTSIATLPGYLNVVALAFVRPDLRYIGNLDLGSTGLEYHASGRVLRDAIDLLKQRQPATRVLLSVGGATYRGWRRYDEAALARLVRDLHADGVDIDYEPARPGCAPGPDQHVACRSDAVWAALVQRTRAVLPHPALVTASVWSVGAYGEGAFRTSSPASRYTGVMLALLRSPVAAQLDLLSINGYDAGLRYDPLEAFRAYRAVWSGPLALGLAVRSRNGSGPYFTEQQAEALAREVARDRQGAMMLYPLLAMPEGAGSDSFPDGRRIAMALCRGMGMEGCGEAAP